MATYQISCTIGTTDASADISLEIWLDNIEIFTSTHVAGEIPITFDATEDEAEHELRFVMKNKSHKHTQIDELGNIINDARLTISNVAFDEIELKQMFIDHAEYTHDFNGTQAQTTGKFYGEMGCNGTVSLKFSTPIYLWLLENM